MKYGRYCRICGRAARVQTSLHRIQFPLCVLVSCSGAPIAAVRRLSRALNLLKLKKKKKKKKKQKKKKVAELMGRWIRDFDLDVAAYRDQQVEHVRIVAMHACHAPTTLR
jgi:hypothetical protein